MTDANKMLELADEYERGLSKMRASGYEEFGPKVQGNHELVIKALRHAAGATNALTADVAARPSEPVAYRVRHPTFNHGRWLFLAGRPVSSKDWKDIEPLYSSPQPATTQKETL